MQAPQVSCRTQFQTGRPTNTGGIFFAYAVTYFPPKQSICRIKWRSEAVRRGAYWTIVSRCRLPANTGNAVLLSSPTSLSVHFISACVQKTGPLGQASKGGERQLRGEMPVWRASRTERVRGARFSTTSRMGSKSDWSVKSLRVCATWVIFNSGHHVTASPKARYVIGHAGHDTLRTTSGDAGTSNRLWPVPNSTGSLQRLPGTSRSRALPPGAPL